MTIKTPVLERILIQSNSVTASLPGGLLILILMGLFASSAHAGWERQWIDPFDGTGVDFQDNWTAQIQANYNNEVQCYTDDDSSPNQNYDVSGGTLKIIARKQTVNCTGLGGQTRTWTSGRLNSKDKQEFLYGRIESRIRFSTLEGGTWPAFWMLEGRINEDPIKGDGDNVPWNGPGAGEIDVWEWFSNDPDSYITNFFNSSGCGNVQFHPYPGGAADVLDWHTYAIEWSEDEISFFRDTTQVATYNVTNCAQYKEPMFVLLNVAIGGNLGGDIAQSLTTATMEVDYVAHCSATTANSITQCNEQTPQAEGGNGGGEGNASILSVIDNFESGLPAGSDASGNTIGFATFAGVNSSVDIAPSSPPSPVPSTGNQNTVLQVNLDTVSFAGFIHKFENETADTWVSQDWTDFEALRFWMLGMNSGVGVFIDLLDNRTPGSTVDDAERFTVSFLDDFTGWQQMEFQFTEFQRKDIGNGAPNDGLNLDKVNGWAFGTLDTSGPRTYYFDNVEVFASGRTTEDFDNDGDSDVLLRRSDNGAWRLFDFGSGSIAGNSGIGLFMDADWTHQANADFDNDGDADVLMRHDDGSWRIFEIQDGAVQGSMPMSLFLSSLWQLQAAYDFDNDGDADILARKTDTGQWRIFEVEDLQVIASSEVFMFQNALWTFQDLKDFDGDGDGDVLLRRSDNGKWRVFEFENGTPQVDNEPGLFNSLVWTHQAAGDMDKDGVADVVLRNDAGAWRAFDFADRASQGVIPLNVFGNTDWQFAQEGDYDGDGDTDLLLRRTSDGAWRFFEIENHAVQGNSQSNIWPNQAFEVQR